VAVKKKPRHSKPTSKKTVARAASRTSDRARSARTAETRPRPGIELPDDELSLLVDLPDPDGRNDEWTDAAGRVREPHESELAAGDPDADVTATGSGEEAVGGSSPTPEQNDVDDIGRALGVSYQPEEPLHTTEKIERRDHERWELNPASSEDFAERQNRPKEPPKRTRQAR